MTAVVSQHATPVTTRALVVIARLVLATFAYLTVLAVLAGALYVVSLMTGAAPTFAVSMLGLAIAEGGALGAVLLVWRFVDRRPVVEMGFGRTQLLQRWLRGAGVAALMMGFMVLVVYRLLDDAVFSSNPDPAQAALALVAGFVGFLVQGPAEEVLFRGYVLENVRARWGMWWGVAVSSVTFSLLHASNPGFGMLPFVNLVLFGVAMALYKLRWDAGQLWGVFAIHTVWNWLQEVVFGLPNSGHGSAPDSTLLHAQVNANVPDFISGGGFGPEGTLGATLVLGVLIWVTLVRSQRR
jgi:membrane protease YdiL (CAAX protease family)